MARRYRRSNDPRFARRRLLLALILIALAAAVLAGVYIARRSSSPLTATELPFSEDEPYLFTGRGYLYITGGTQLGYYDLEDESRNYSATLPDTQVSLAASETLHAVYNATAAQIVGASESILFPGRALYVRCGDSYMAALVENDSGTRSIAVYNKNGVLADTIGFSGSAYPTGFGFYSTPAETFWVMSLDTTSSLPVTTISTYDMGRLAATGVMTVQRQLIGDIVVGANGIFMVGTQSIIRFSHTGNTETWSVLIYGWEMYDYNTGSRPLFLLTRRGDGDSGIVRLLSVNDDAAAESSAVTVAKPENLATMFLSGGRLYFVTDEKLMIYSAAGKKTGTLELPITVSRAEAAGTGRFLACSNGKMYLITIK